MDEGTAPTAVGSMTPSFAAPVPVEPRAGRSFWTRFARTRIGPLGAAVVLLTLVMAVFAPVIAPHNPFTQFNNGLSLDGVPVAPEWHLPYILGTDDLGRDVLSRLIWGARVSMEVGVFATLINVGLGVLLGLLAATSGNVVENALMRFTDMMLAFPFYLFVLLLVAIFGHTSPLTVVFVLGVLGWPPIVRMVRGQAMVVRELDYVQSSRASGAGQWRVMLRHILPNVLPTILVYSSLTVSGNMMAESGLSFLGVGVPPTQPSWGGMIAEGLQNYQTAPWILIFPGIALAIACIGFNLLAEGMADAMNIREGGAS
jgi:ABC-type dipeptide/oligopeptide/nickel transport system permease subunit